MGHRTVFSLALISSMLSSQAMAVTASQVAQKEQFRSNRAIYGLQVRRFEAYCQGKDLEGRSVPDPERTGRLADLTVYAIGELGKQKPTVDSLIVRKAIDVAADRLQTHYLPAIREHRLAEVCNSTETAWVLGLGKLLADTFQ